MATTIACLHSRRDSLLREHELRFARSDYLARSLSATRHACQAAASRRARQHLDHAIDFRLGRAQPEAESHRVLRACDGQAPSRCSTCDGSSVPDEHADPVDTAMPSRSSAMSSDSASTRSKLMFVVFGTRRSRAPLTAVPGHAAQDAALEPIAQRRRAARASASILLRAHARRRRPCPTIAGTFSVPARRLRSCLPPVSIGETARARA